MHYSTQRTVTLRYLGYVHTVTFSYCFLLFESKLKLPWDCGTIQNQAKTLPCARSLTLRYRRNVTLIYAKLMQNLCIK